MIIIFPTLSIIVSLGCIILMLDIKLCILTLFFGILICGILPLILVRVYKIDVATFPRGKSILVAIYTCAIIISYVFAFGWLAEDANIYIIPVLSVVAEIIYTVTKQMDRKQKLVMFLISPVITYSAMLIDILSSF